MGVLFVGVLFVGVLLVGVSLVGVDSCSNRRYKALALDQIIEALRENESLKNVTIRYCPV
jgi:hypothetical protein